MAKKKEKKILHGLLGSTEAGARYVKEKYIDKPKKKPEPERDTGGKRTAKDTHKKKTAAQAAKELAAIRKKREAQVKAAQKKAAQERAAKKKKK